MFRLYRSNGGKTEKGKQQNYDKCVIFLYLNSCSGYSWKCELEEVTYSPDNNHSLTAKSLMKTITTLRTRPHYYRQLYPIENSQSGFRANLIDKGNTRIEVISHLHLIEFREECAQQRNFYCCWESLKETQSNSFWMENRFTVHIPTIEKLQRRWHTWGLQAIPEGSK